MSVAEDPKICWLDILRADIYKKASETRHCPRSARHGCKDPLPRRAVARRRQRLRDQEGLRGRPVQPLPPGKLRIDLSGPERAERRRPRGGARPGAAKAPGQEDLFPHTQGTQRAPRGADRSEEHTSELQSLMRISYAVFCLE